MKKTGFNIEIKDNEKQYIILHKIQNKEGKELATLISKWNKE